MDAIAWAGTVLLLGLVTASCFGRTVSQTRRPAPEVIEVIEVMEGRTH
jgi:hypothetical protein